MKNYEQYKRLIRFTSSAVVLSLQMIIYWYFWLRHYNILMDEPYNRTGNWLMVAVYGILLVIFGMLYGGLKLGYLKTTNTIYSQTLASICANALIYLQITLLTKHFQTLMPLLLMTLLDFIITVIWSLIAIRVYRTIYPPRKLLLIYGEHPIEGLMGKFKSREDRFVVEKAMHISDGIENLLKEILKYEGVMICDVPSQIRNQLLKYCYGKSIRTYTTPKISDVIVRSAESLHMFDTPLMLSRNNGLNFEQRLVKRGMDVIFSFIAIITLSPIFLITAVAVKLCDKGPIIYKQKRLTINNKEFFIYKFRSMYVNSEADGIARLATEGDSRITPIGKFIRMIRLDELPQLINILKGDMSIVGPRPERPEIALEYEKEIPEFSYRLKVKAGLTGYAQVYGKYNTTSYDKLKLDLMYIENYSVLLDIEIMFKTLKILFLAESTEGVSEGQITTEKKQGKCIGGKF